MPNYLPYEQRQPNNSYARLLKKIMKKGEFIGQTRQGVDAITLLDVKMSGFELAHGFPVITERSLGPKKSWNKGIGELCGFINGVTQADVLAKEFGADWWDDWTDAEKCAMFGLEPGDIGPASYGGAFHDFPTLDGDRFDQYEYLVKAIKKNPYDRVHRVVSWMPKENCRAEPGLQKNTIAPCHGDVYVQILNERIHLGMKQRSADMPIGVPFNMTQYAALTLMLEHLTGFEAGVYYHSFWNAHIYETQFKNVILLGRREPRALPTVELSETGKRITDIHDFRREHFVLSDYHPHPAMNDIPVHT